MTTMQLDGRQRPRRVRCRLRLLMLLGSVAWAAGCTSRGAEREVAQSLAEMEIRIRLLQSELGDVRQAIAARDLRQDQRTASEQALATQLDDLQQRITDLPQTLSGLCPEAREPSALPQCDASPEVQRVVVSGDKLVVGSVERIWLVPPSVFLAAHIDAGEEYSQLHAGEVVEFERDGNKWVRFELTPDEETVTVERRLKRYVKVHNARRPIVDLRVQLGDVRETVEFALGELPEQDRPLVLGRNFLTDVALLDVAREFVQPAFKASSE